MRSQSKANSNCAFPIEVLNDLKREISFDVDDRVIDDQSESKTIPECPSFNSKLHQFNNDSCTAYNRNIKENYLLENNLQQHRINQ